MIWERHTTKAVAAAIPPLALVGRASAQPAPRPLAVLDVPFISQSEALCGGAAAAMVLRYWGERGLNAESFAHLVDRSAAGIRTSALVGELRSRGWGATGIVGSRAQIEQELDRGRPVLALIEDRPGTYHYIVIVAATPVAVVFHDPARAPTRVMSSDEFGRRWGRADRWMAVVLPPAPAPGIDAPAPAPSATGPDTPCARLVERGVLRAHANDLDAAERDLAAALSCPGSAALRELAGVRLLQRRWSDVEALADAAVRADPGDAHAWRLLATSRFLQDDGVGALEAWNRVSEPRIDVLAVAGLARTRHRVVERLIGAAPGDVLTPDTLHRARRRLATLPAAAATRLEYVPVPSALVELRASVDERPPVPTDIWTYAALGVSAAARRELEYGTGSWTGGGERLAGAWRFWPHRPRVAASIAAPAPFGGIWAAAAAWERQAFDRADMADAERTSAELRVSDWVSPVVEVMLRGGLDEWRTIGTFGRGGATVRFATPGDRVDSTVSVEGWAGPHAFGRLQATVIARSSVQGRGRVYIARGGAAAATSATPADAWFGGDTGKTRTTLLRAHPMVDDGRLRSERLGRRLLTGSAEVQQWWPVSVVRVGAAVFADTGVTAARLAPGVRRDVDAGVGLRLALPGMPGMFRLDVARGLRDGATAWSFVYEP